MRKTAFYMAAVLLATGALNAFAREQDAPGNCVDASIVEFLKANGKAVSLGDIHEGAIRLGFAENPLSRSLQECVALLRQQGIDCDAVRVRLSEVSSFPPSAILYFQPQSGGLGHCVFFSDDGGLLRIFDVASTPQWNSLSPSEITAPHDAILITHSSFLRRGHVIEYLGWLAGSVLIALVVYLISLLARRRSTSVAAVVICLAILHLSGCNGEGDSRKTSLVRVADVGIVNGDDTNGTIRQTFSIRNPGAQAARIDRVETSCFCTSISDEVSIPAGGFADVPVSVDVSNKVGAFAETVRVFLTGTESPYVLTVQGFIKRNPIASHAKVEVKAFGGATGDAEVSFVYHRMPDGAPAELSGISFPEEHSDLFTVKDTTRIQSTTIHGYVTDRFVTTIAFNPADASAVETTLTARWSFPGGETNMPVRGLVVPAVELYRDMELVSARNGRPTLIPVRVHSASVAEHVQLAVDDPAWRCALDLANSSISVTVDRSRSLNAECLVQLYLDSRSIGELTLVLED